MPALSTLPRSESPVPSTVEATQLLSDLCPSGSTRCRTRCGQASKEAPVSWGRVTATGCRELEVASACVLLGSFFVSKDSPEGQSLTAPVRNIHGNSSR